MKNDMRYGFTIFIIAVFGLINPTLSAQGSLVEGFAFEQNTKLGRGVNIIGYDSLWHFADKARMKDKHFRLIKNAGFDNVRIVIMPFKFSLNDVDFKLDQKFFKTLDWAVTQSLENNLMAIIDFHEHHAMQEDPLGNKPMFLSMWKQIAEHYKDSPSSVLFEIANEPNMNPEIWNEIHKEALALLRESNPDRTILIGPIYGNQIKHLKDLELPENDRNLIIAVHYYSPIQFTHQGAPWSSNTKDLSGITWTNLPEEEQAIIDDFDIAQKWSKKYNRPITLGEFGAYEKAELPSRIRWTSFVARHAESLGWSWSYWQFDSDFIVYDIDKDEWFEPILNALIPENKPKKN
ncbi:MAG: glycoside hydrolase family 5 protein [Melioribacteraceae bacterium]|nr:glycoside hydrolase family 5 protein [Melioribacteraceae bacterium]MCF8266330.1 glycoside hydrolase family 5 protein [Melioribacteraceae bacterium]